VTFWGYDQIGGATALASADQFNLGNTNSLAAGGNYTETELVKDTPMNIGTVMKAKRSASPVISRCARAATPSLRASIRSKCSASKSANVVSTAGFQSLDPCVFLPPLTGRGQSPCEIPAKKFQVKDLRTADWKGFARSSPANITGHFIRYLL